MNSFRTMLALTAVTALAVGVSGCTTVDRAGGKAATEVTTLTFAQPNDGTPPAQLQTWADLVEEASDGSLEIEFKNGWRVGQTDHETGTIADVAAGEADLAWVGARAFDRVGVTDFQALLAPMLVDGHDLQSAVFDQGIPDEMLAGVQAAGVTGIAILPGPMRKVLGISKPFREPQDFRGAVVGMQDSALTQAALEALGATTKAEPSGADLEGLDAYEQQLDSINGNGYVISADYVTGNLDLWPRPLVVFANPEALDALSDAQRSALVRAGEDAVLPALDTSRAQDAQAADQLCKQGMALVEADEDQLAALAQAWRPVYDDLAADAQTAAWLDRIEAIKESLATGPDLASCEGTTPASRGGVLPNGTYRATMTLEEVQASCQPGDLGAENLAGVTGDVTLEFDIDGDRVTQTDYPPGHPELREKGWVGTYRTFRDTFELIEAGIDDTVASTFDFDGHRLLLTDMQTDWCDGPAVWTGHPWVLVERAPDEDATSDPVEGDYQATIDWPAADVPTGCAPAAPEGTSLSIYDLALHDGQVSMTLRVGDPDAPVEHAYTGTYRVFRDQIELTDSVGVLTADFEVSRRSWS